MISVHNLGINSRVILTAIIPVIIFAVSYGFYFNKVRNQDLLDELNKRGNLIAINLASASEFPVATRNVDQVRILLDSIMNQNDVVGVRILDETGQQLLRRGDYGDNSKGDISLYTADIVSRAFNDTELYTENRDRNREDSNILLGSVEVYISNESYLIWQKAILVRTFVFTFIGISLSIIIAILVGNSLVRPVREVISAVSSITRGNLASRASGNASGELGKLQAGINEMAETIELSQTRLEREIKQATAKLKNTVKELESKNIELDQARTEAMKAKDSKSEFLANMSHEIRTPLNAIIGFSRQLDKTQLDEKQQDFTRTINTAAQQLLTVIDDILCFSKLESNNLEVNPSDFSLRESLEDIIAMLSHVASEKNIELVLLFDADVPDIVKGDQDRIAQVLINLTNNAIKFTDHGSVVVHVSADEDTETLSIKVSDTGCGISQAAQEKLFTSFFQENKPANKRHGGTGLGLVICQRLVEMMGGKLTFKSEEAVGSEFYFQVPLVFISMHDHAIIDRTVNVFILDSNSHSRKSLRNNLAHMGFRVFAVEKHKQLINNIRTLQGEDDSFVFVSVPANDTIDHYFKHIHNEIRTYHKGLIILLSNQDYFASNLVDPDIQIISKPARLSTLSSILITGEKVKLSDICSSNHAHFNGHNALVAEDNEFNQKYLTSLLENMGIAVRCVDTGYKALDEAKRQNYDLIFMDLHMPELDGMNATRMIRNLPEGQNTLPIIAITADVFANDNNELTRTGFNDCLFKPIDEDQLLGLIQKYLASGNPVPTQNSTDTETASKDRLKPLSDDMHQRLYADLSLQYSTLKTQLAAARFPEAREQIHTILGLISYFKVSELDTLIAELKKAVHTQDIEKSMFFCDKAIELTEQLKQLNRHNTGTAHPVQKD